MKLKTTKITKLDKLDSFGNTTFVIEFATGERGFYTSKDPDQKKFTVGQETECTLEEKEGKKGKYFKITLPQFQKHFAGKPPVEPRVQMIGFAMSYTKDLIVAGKIGVSDMPTTFDIIYNEMISKI